MYQCVYAVYLRNSTLCTYAFVLLYIYISPISHSSGNEHIIYKNILLLLYRYRTGVFFRVKSLLHSSCASITCGICVSPHKKCTRMHTCTYTIINAIHIYIYRRFILVYFRLLLNGICRTAVFLLIRAQ